MESKQIPPEYNEQPPPYDPMAPSGSYPPPPMGFHPTVQQPMTHTNIVILPLEMGGESRRMTCPHCQAEISTTVIYKDGRMTHIAALILCLFGCYCCCCIPYCMDSCKDAEHECPNCHRHLGTYRR